MAAAGAPTYHDLKVALTCTREGCGAPAADDSNLCPPHRDAGRERAREGMRKIRRARRRARVCMVCGGPRPRGVSVCDGCKIKLHRVPASVAVNQSVNKSERIAAAKRKHADGRTRYHGQGKRGQQPKAQLNDQDFEMALACITSGRRGLALFASPAVQDRPRIQREEVCRAATDELDRAIRHLEDVMVRMGHFRQRHGSRGE